MDVKNITKQQLKEAFDHHPNSYVNWAIKHYSLNLRKTPKPIGSYISLISFIIATIGMILFDKLGMHTYASIFASLYILFALWGVITLPAYIMIKLIHRKICKELDISMEDLYVLLSLYEL